MSVKTWPKDGETLYYKTKFLNAFDKQHKHQYVAWCAQSKRLGDGPYNVGVGATVEYEYGATQEEALTKLKRHFPRVVWEQGE